MTIKELYDKAVELGIEDYELWTAYYSDFCPVDDEVVNDDEKRVYV